MKNRAHGWLPKLGVMTLGLLASLASPVRVHAAEGEAAKPAGQDEAFVQPFEVGVFGGLHFYDKKHTLGRNTESPEGLSPDLGGAFGLRLTYNVIKWAGVELEGMLSPTHTRWSNDNGGMKYNVLSLRAHAIVNFIHDGYVRPFALIGAGTMSGFPQYTDRLKRDTDGYYHLGVGSKFPINDDFGLRFDARVMAPFAVFSGIAKAGDETHWNAPDYEVLLSAYMAFGGSRPTPPPPPPPAPPKDSDGDGIPDTTDACPTQPGPRSDDPAKNGCPPPKDTDGDGIPDAKDACPTEAGPSSDDPAKHGCPLPRDSDGDGILDNVDKCPKEPETFNGFQDADGCPDEIPAEIKKFTGIIEGINYKTNSAEITNKSFPVLDKAFKVLSDYSDIRIEISGHTDNVGKDEYNKELSQKRADAVKAYFVSKGISESRLVAVGFGEEKPIADNKTKAGKAKNRRTEFRLLTGNN